MKVVRMEGKVYVISRHHGWPGRSLLAKDGGAKGDVLIHVVLQFLDGGVSSPCHYLSSPRRRGSSKIRRRTLSLRHDHMK